MNWRSFAVCNTTAAPLQVAIEFGKKWQSGKQNKTITCPMWQLFSKIFFYKEDIQK